MLYHLLYPLHDYHAIFNVFRYITFRTAYATLTALIISLILGPWIIKKLSQYGARQYIREEGPSSHKSKEGTPTMGGVLILFPALFSTVLWADLTNYYVWVVVFVTLAFGSIGFVDDYTKLARKNNRGLGIKAKLFVQISIAITAALLLYLNPEFNSQLILPFFKKVMPDLGWFYVVFILLVIVGCSNAVNLTDGLDGLAMGLLVIAYTTYLVFSYCAGHFNIANYLQIAYVTHSGELAVFCGAMVGASMGFLWFNAYPAQVFMGDVGSLALGASLGTVAVIIKQEIILLLVGALFVVEALSVIFQVGYFRLSHGGRIFKMAPIHHHFELKGWSEPKIIVRFWIIAIMLALLAVSTLKLR